MNTARIVALTLALSTGSIAACLADRPADSRPARIESIVQLLAAAGTGDARLATTATTAAQR